MIDIKTSSNKINETTGNDYKYFKYSNNIVVSTVRKIAIFKMSTIAVLILLICIYFQYISIGASFAEHLSDNNSTSELATLNHQKNSINPDKWNINSINTSSIISERCDGVLDNLRIRLTLEADHTSDISKRQSINLLDKYITLKVDDDVIELRKLFTSSNEGYYNSTTICGKNGLYTLTKKRISEENNKLGIF